MSAVRCDSCGVVRVSTPLDVDEYRRMYQGDDALVHLADHMTNASYDRILQRLEPYRRGGKLLEIGFGSGDFLLRAASHGWQCYGTEYDRRGRDRITSSIPVENLFIGEVGDAPFAQGGEFDVVVLLEVLEHLFDPNETMKMVRHLTRRSGAIYLTTPNHGSLARRLLGPNWREYRPDHLTFFTRSALRGYLGRNGFQAKGIWCTGFDLVSVRSGLRRLGRSTDDAATRSVTVAQAQRTQTYRLRRLASRLGPVKTFTNYVLDLTGLGDSLKCLAEV